MNIDFLRLVIKLEQREIKTTPIESNFHHKSTFTEILLKFFVVVVVVFCFVWTVN